MLQMQLAQYYESVTTFSHFFSSFLATAWLAVGSMGPQLLRLTNVPLPHDSNKGVRNSRGSQLSGWLVAELQAPQRCGMYCRSAAGLRFHANGNQVRGMRAA